MSGDLARTHAAGVHRDDLLVEAGKAALVFADQLRIEAALPVARNGKLERSGVGQNRLLAVAVARIAALITLQVMIQLGLQRTIGERLLQLVDQAFGSKASWVGPDSNWSRIASGITGSLRGTLGIYFHYGDRNDTLKGADLTHKLQAAKTMLTQTTAGRRRGWGSGSAVLDEPDEAQPVAIRWLEH